MIENPILPGFNPDPSICRVGSDYYIATSTFEWFPGVQIHHSTDLVNWRLVSRPLTRTSQLDMRGNPDSCGVWAPCLSYADGKFWLVYTDVKRLDGSFKDAHNYIVTCDTIDGSWSDPTYVNSHGFDPTLFHDDDGRKWFANLRWNHRGLGKLGSGAHQRFDGILLQEWSPERGLFGPIRQIYTGTDRGLTEGPHLFKRNGWYYLTTAEGGTGYQHAVTMSRSRDIWGPYENHPDLHLICTADAPDSPIQRTGHGQYVEAPDGTAWHTFLLGRPIPDASGDGRYCPLGRETGIARCIWRDDWLYLEDGGMVPPVDIDAAANHMGCASVVHERFSDLPDEFQWLRTPDPSRIFHVENGQLVLTGRESLGSWFEQSLVARRQEHFSYEAATSLAFEPTTYQQAAGLTTYYNRWKFHAAMVTHDDDLGRILTLMSCLGDYPEGPLAFPMDTPIALQDGSVHLSVEVAGPLQQFYYHQGDNAPQKLGPALPAYIISDEGGRGEHASFTGAFVGMVAFDTTGQGQQAKFSRFAYHPKPFQRS